MTQLYSTQDQVIIFAKAYAKAHAALEFQRALGRKRNGGEEPTDWSYEQDIRYYQAQLDKATDKLHKASKNLLFKQA